jgi:hypothetical protein
LPLPQHENLLLSLVFTDFGRGKPLPYEKSDLTAKPKFAVKENFSPNMLDLFTNLWYNDILK